MARHSKTAIFNLALAGLAGAAAGFAIYAMPADLLEALVAKTGLPSLLTAASPPLGATARLCIVGAAALSLFLPVWLVLRAVDRPAPRKQPFRFAADVDDESKSWWPQPSQDRRPDVPVRQPLRAFELDEVSTPRAAPRLAVNDTLELGIDQIAQDETAPAAAALPARDDETGMVWDPAPLHLHADDADEGISTAELLARLPLPAHESASVASLVQRLNSGLANSEWPLPNDDGDEHAGEMDDRLRGVLDDLQKMAGGNG